MTVSNGNQEKKSRGQRRHSAKTWVRTREREREREGGEKWWQPAVVLPMPVLLVVWGRMNKKKKGKGRKKKFVCFWIFQLGIISETSFEISHNII